MPSTRRNGQSMGDYRTLGQMCPAGAESEPLCGNDITTALSIFRLNVSMELLLFYLFKPNH